MGVTTRDSAAQKLGELTQTTSADSGPEVWAEVASSAQTVANGLRVRDDADDPHTVLGKTALPRNLTKLVNIALNGSHTPDMAYTAAVVEILRVAANLCMDHDENRGHLLDAGLPQLLVSLLEGYMEMVPPDPPIKKLSLPVPHLKVIRTAIGVLLNASIGYDGVKQRLISLEAAATLARISLVACPPGAWTEAQATDEEGNPEESWNLRCTLSSWAWRTISELKDDSRSIYGPDILPTLIPPLVAFIPPHSIPSPSSFFAHASETRTALIQNDFDLLEESCMLVESLALDVEDVRLSLARGHLFPAEHNGVPCFSTLLDFIEKGKYSPLWYSDSGFGETELRRKEKSFDICKAAVIKAVVEVAGEDKNDDVLWDDSEADKPGGVFVARMVDWLRNYVKSKEADSSDITMDGGKTDGSRDDLAICASLSLGNLARREINATVLLSAPYDLAPLLCSRPLLSVSTDVKIKHGVIGLLKHIAQSSSKSASNRQILTDANVVQRVTESGVWDERSDVMAEVIQIGAIGVVKHLCSGSLGNTLVFVLESSSAPTTGLNQILSLIRRSDNVAIKSEGTRVLVNVIKSLVSGEGAPQDPNNTADLKKRRQQALAAVTTPSVADALARLVARSSKYPVLVNEGLVALSLLSTQTGGAPIVASAITTPLPAEVPQGSGSASAAGSTVASTSSEVGSPVVTSPASRSRVVFPQSVLIMLKSILRSGKVSSGEKSLNSARPVVFPIEVRANICVLLGQVGRRASNEDASKIKDATKGALEEVGRGADEKDGILAVAARKTLEAWV